MRVTDEMVNAARSAYSVDRIPNGEIINKIAGPGYGDKLIRGIIDSALSHAAGQEVDGRWDYIQTGFLIDGPNGTAMVLDRSFIEPKIAALCENNGDDPEDYTATELFMKVWRGRAVDMPIASSETHGGGQ